MSMKVLQMSVGGIPTLTLGKSGKESRGLMMLWPRVWVTASQTQATRWASERTLSVVLPPTIIITDSHVGSTCNVPSTVPVHELIDSVQ